MALSHTYKPSSEITGLASELEILGTSADLLRARCRNLYVMRWSGECSVADLNVVFSEIRLLGARYKRVAVISLLDSGCKPPTPEGREIVAGQQAQLAERLVLANLVDGQGFWASIVLNALLGIQTRKGNRILDRERVFRQREEACLWLKQFVEGGALAHDVDRVIHECREVAHQVALATAS